jgi:GT2 family glycosyltransferase
VTLSIIIVSYNVKKLLDECLASVAKAAENITAEVFIVDNASTDHTVSELSPRFPLFQFIDNSQNTGFAKANNQALLLATGEFVLFLNPDTIVPADCFEKCLAFMNEHPEAGALGVKMMNGNNEFLKESKRGLPTPITSFWKLSGIIRVFPRSRIFARYYLGHLNESQTHEVEVLSGAFLWARKKVLDVTGGFDERFFMYAEDIDLSWRILQAGYKNFYFAGTSIIHYKGASTKKDFRYVKQFYLAMSQFAKKHYGRGVFTLFLDGAIFMRGSIEALRQMIRKKK